MRWRTVMQIGVVLALALGIASYVVYGEYHNAQYDEFIARAFEECRRGHLGGARKNLELARQHITSSGREDDLQESSNKIARKQCE